MTREVPRQKRRCPRISLPKGMYVAWPPVGTKLRLAFEVPGGNVQAEAIVRNIVRGEGMGVEFTKLRLKDRILLEMLLKRLLR